MGLVFFGLGLGVGWLVFKKKRVTISGRLGSRRRRRA